MTKISAGKSHRSSSNSGLGQAHLRFWTEFHRYMAAAGSPVQCAKATEKHYMSHPIGVTGFNLGSTIIGENAPASMPELRVELVVAGQPRFAAIENFREEVHRRLGVHAVWHSRPGVTMHRIYVRKPTNFTRESAWPEQFAWLKVNLEKFQSVFVPIINGLDHSAFKD